MHFSSLSRFRGLTAPACRVRVRASSPICGIIFAFLGFCQVVISILGLVLVISLFGVGQCRLGEIPPRPSFSF